MGGGPPGFTRGFTSLVLLWYASQRLVGRFAYGTITRSGATFQTLRLRLLQLKAPATPGRIPVWAVPRSLAATDGIDVSFFSTRYLDVSGPWVGSAHPMHSDERDGTLLPPGFPIQKSPDQRLFASFPELIAGYHVFRRLSMPRHPPYTLKSLATFIDHRRRKSIADSR